LSKKDLLEALVSQGFVVESNCLGWTLTRWLTKIGMQH